MSLRHTLIAALEEKQLPLDVAHSKLDKKGMLVADSMRIESSVQSTDDFLPVTDIVSIETDAINVAITTDIHTTNENNDNLVKNTNTNNSPLQIKQKKKSKSN